MIDLTISIVNHKNRALLEPLLDSILAQTRGITYEIYVVDNASQDGSVEMVREQFPQVNLICNTSPEGFAANNNKVLRQARGRYCILLNDDMLLVNNALAHMVSVMDANPSAGAIGCKLLNEDGSLQRSCWRGFPSPRTLLIDLFYLSKVFPRAAWVRDFEATLHDSDCPIEVDYLLGACLLIRQEVVRQVGLLDESFFMFLEETDWCYRIKEAGWQILWAPQGEIIHYGQQSVSKNPERFVPLLYRNYGKFSRKHNNKRPNLMALKGVIAIGVLFRAIIWASRYAYGVPNSAAMARGYLKVFRLLPSY